MLGNHEENRYAQNFHRLEIFYQLHFQILRRVNNRKVKRPEELYRTYIAAVAGSGFIESSLEAETQGIYRCSQCARQTSSAQQVQKFDTAGNAPGLKRV